MTSKVTDKGQVTIPKILRDRLGLDPGQEVEFEEQGGAIVVRRRVRRDPLRELVGMVKERTDVDAYLSETRGAAWQADLDAPEDPA